MEADSDSGLHGNRFAVFHARLEAPLRDGFNRFFV
jgi:hypothetical protein